MAHRCFVTQQQHKAKTRLLAVCCEVNLAFEVCPLGTLGTGYLAQHANHCVLVPSIVEPAWPALHNAFLLCPADAMSE